MHIYCLYRNICTYIVHISIYIENMHIL